jgi:hypothetical protein
VIGRIDVYDKLNPAPVLKTIVRKNIQRTSSEKNACQPAFKSPDFLRPFFGMKTAD